MLNERFSQYFINTSHMLTDMYTVILTRGSESIVFDMLWKVKGVDRLNIFLIPNHNMLNL